VARLLDWISAAGAIEIVLKAGPERPFIRQGGRNLVPVLPPVEAIVDTTGAGDCFSAGYLAARLAGAPPQQAALARHSLAARVIAHHGAIIPRAAMPG
jgi:2-dehydro-3-deoxygluconokinase